VIQIPQGPPSTKEELSQQWFEDPLKKRGIGGTSISFKVLTHFIAVFAGVKYMTTPVTLDR
jgi:hypothetical protein